MEPGMVGGISTRRHSIVVRIEDLEGRGDGDSGGGGDGSRGGSRGKNAVV
jgi:hypothetical protein